MKLTLSALATLLATASATAIDLERRDSTLFVSLNQIEDSKVKFAVINNDEASYKLFYKGTFLDHAPTDKLSVTSDSSKASFLGILQRIATSSLTEDSFKSIGAGGAIEVEIELAELHDLSKSGKCNVLAQSVIEYAEADSTALSGAVLSYSSNQLSIDVDAANTAMIETALQSLSKRTAVQSDCSGTRLTAIRTTLSNCNRLATAAATAATSGSASKFQEYFKTTFSSTRSTVAARLRAVASDCASTSGGKTRIYCTDIYGGCESNVLACTLPSNNYIAYCPLLFNQLPALSGQCHQQDQATTVLYEETHSPAVYSPGTENNGYGYSAASSLSAARALANADSYALYANAIYAGC